MPTIQENLTYWSSYDWKNEGREWNVGYGGTDVAWDWAIFPRLRRFLPTEHILEIAPGYGVWTELLRPHATRMTLVDVTPACIEACRAKFGPRNMEYHVNDGTSLKMVPDASVSLVFSWHSLVHAEHDVMGAYVRQLGRKLRPGGFGLIHHSNFGAYVDPETGQPTIANTQWRGSTMTAEKFRDDCAAAGLRCIYQELVPWGSEHFVDCFSLFTRAGSPSNAPTIVDKNPTWWEFIRMGERVSRRYQPDPAEPTTW